MDKKSHGDIARRAYEIWERQGRPHGKDFDHWLEAERQDNGQGKAARPETRDSRSPASPERGRSAPQPQTSPTPAPSPRADQPPAADTRPCRPRKAESSPGQPATPAMPAKARRPSTAPRKPPKEQG